MDTSPPASPLARAVQVAGNPATLARLIGVTAPAVSQWLSGDRPIPPARCADVERATGVPVEELRPDLTWTRDKARRVTGYHVALPAVA